MKIDFERILGHDTLKVLFRQIVESEEWAPAYIFEGPSGVGKASFALEIVKAANCHDKETKPCQTCSVCKRVNSFQFPDLWVLLPEKPEGLRNGLGKGKGVRPPDFDSSREISIKQVRDIKEELSRPPYEGKRRFILVLNAENLSLPAQNAMLKILEEPPPHSTFLLISSTPEKVLSTIRSRARRVHFSSLPYDVFSKYSFETEIPLPLLFRLSSGCIGEALQLLDSEVWGVRKKILEYLEKGEVEKILDLINPFMVDKNELRTLIEILVTLGRDLLLSKVETKNIIMHVDLEDEIHKTARVISTNQIETFIKIALESEESLSKYLPSHLVILPLFSPFFKGKSEFRGGR